MYWYTIYLKFKPEFKEDNNMLWLKRMLLGGFIANVIYIAFMFLLPNLSILVNTLLSGSCTGGILFFLIKKGHI